MRLHQDFTVVLHTSHIWLDLVLQNRQPILHHPIHMATHQKITADNWQSNEGV